MTPPLPENLCTSCGLCCDGSLFAEVELRNRAESFVAESFGLEVEDGEDGELLIQPCCALKGTRCSIYQYRPKCCRTFECRLLRDVDQRKRTLAEAHKIIRETKELIAEIVRGCGIQDEHKQLPLKERYFAALEQIGEKDSARSGQLNEAMHRLERGIQANFLT